MYATEERPEDLYRRDGFWDWCDTLALPAALVVIVSMIGAVLLL